MISVLYYDSERERQIVEEYTDTLRNNGIAVIPIPSEGVSVACPGCEYSQECEYWELDGWCIIDTEGRQKKINNQQLEKEVKERKYIKGELYIHFKEHPHSDEEGYVRAAQLIIELVVNKRSSISVPPYFYWSEDPEGYFLSPEYKVVYLDGDSRNLDLDNLDVTSRLKQEVLNVWIIHPGSPMEQ